MIVYLNTTEPRAVHTMMVTPAHNSDSVEFRDDQGKPIQFQVLFEYGRAEVPNNLGRWLVDNEMAIISRLILPARRILRSLTT